MGDFNVVPVALELIPRTIAPRDTLHPLDCVLLTPQWPTTPVTDGVAVSATSTTMTVAGTPWVADEHRGLWVRLTEFDATLIEEQGDTRDIGSNTDHVLTLHGTQTFTVDQEAYLDGGGAYEIGPSGPVEALNLVSGQKVALRNALTGQDAVPQDTYGYLVAGAEASGDPLDEVEYDAYFDATHHLYVTYSHKGSMVTKVRSVMSGTYDGTPYSFNLSWLIRGAYNGLGSGFGGSSYQLEFVDGENGQLTAFANPTHGGSEMRPQRDYTHGPPAILGTPLVRLIPSPPIAGSQVAVGGPPGTAMFRGAVTPLEFDADARANPAQNKGATPQQVAAFFRQKQVEPLDPHISGFSPFLQLRHHWVYDPAVRDHLKCGNLGQFQDVIGCQVASVDDWDEAYWLDPVTGQLTQLDADDFANSIGSGWSAYIQDQTGNGSQHTPYLEAPIYGASPFSGTYGAVILRMTTGPNAGMALGIACKLKTAFEVNTRDSAPTSLGVGISRSAPTTWVADGGEPEDEPRFITLLANGFSYLEQAPGWRGFRKLVFTGPWNAAVPTFLAAYTAGFLDLPPDIETIPATALAGTELEGSFTGWDITPISLGMEVPDAEIRGVVTLIVEDGTGVTDANSYASLSDGATYFALLGDPIAWASATDDKRSRALIIATHEMDLRYGLRWTSRPTSDEQALAHPQGAVYDILGRLITVPPLPQALIHACCEAALRELQLPGSLRPQQSGSSTSAGATLRAGPFSFSSSSGVSSSSANAWQKVDQLLASGGLIDSGLWARR